MGISKSKKNKKKIAIHHSKKCHNCGVHLNLKATECFSCNQKVGKVDKHGIAKKPFDWRGYLTCLVAWITFGIYFWWIFLRKS